MKQTQVTSILPKQIEIFLYSLSWDFFDALGRWKGLTVWTLKTKIPILKNLLTNLSPIFPYNIRYQTSTSKNIYFSLYKVSMDTMDVPKVYWEEIKLRFVKILFHKGIRNEIKSRAYGMNHLIIFCAKKHWSEWSDH